MTNHDLMKEAETLFETYCEKLGIEPWDEVNLMWGAGNHLWGTANYSRKHFKDSEYNYIELNLQMFRCCPEELEPTIAHEVVHMHLFFNCRPTGHGPEFRSIMNKLGFNGAASKRMKNQKPVIGIGG